MLTTKTSIQKYVDEYNDRINSEPNIRGANFAALFIDFYDLNADELYASSSNSAMTEEAASQLINTFDKKYVNQIGYIGGYGAKSIKGVYLHSKRTASPSEFVNTISPIARLLKRHNITFTLVEYEGFEPGLRTPKNRMI